jgi:hypothetical protein
MNNDRILTRLEVGAYSVDLMNGCQYRYYYYYGQLSTGGTVGRWAVGTNSV